MRQRRDGLAKLSLWCRAAYLIGHGLSCPVCGKVSAENRKTHEKFTCVQCGFTANADFVAAVNIKEAGLALLACSQSSAEVGPSRQEPTEGIHAYA